MKYNNPEAVYVAAHHSITQLLRFPFSDRAGELLRLATQQQEAALRAMSIDPEDLEEVVRLERRLGISQLKA